MNNSPGYLGTDLQHEIANPELDKLPVEIAQLQAASRVVYHTDPRSAGADRYRVLRMRLRELQNETKVKSILVTSPLPHDGKSTVILNLATVLSERGHKSVLVVEGDLHRPTLTQKLGLNSGPGLADCLVKQGDPLALIRRIEPLSWYLLPAGGQVANPSELLQTEVLPKMIQELRCLFDWILIDSPPIMPFADTLSLAKTVDSCLLVARAGSTPRGAIGEAIQLLGREHLAGMVLNAVEGLQGYYSVYGYE